MSLWAEFLNHSGRPIHKWKHYFPAYERHFGRYVNRPMTFIEIGCGFGGSLQMWKRYFGPHAQIIGIDINSDCKAFAEDQIAVCIGDQSDPAFLNTVVDEFGPPDIVLDDGSHIMEHIVAPFLSFILGRLQMASTWLKICTQPIGTNMEAAYIGPGHLWSFARICWTSLMLTGAEALSRRPISRATHNLCTSTIASQFSSVAEPCRRVRRCIRQGLGRSRRKKKRAGVGGIPLMRKLTH